MQNLLYHQSYQLLKIHLIVMYIITPQTTGSNYTSIGLRVVHYNNALIDTSYLFTPAPKFHSNTAAQLFKFINSDTHYNEHEISLLLRALQRNQLQQRYTWFMSMKVCRRRSPRPVETTPVNSIFKMQDEYALLQYKALTTRNPLSIP
eukprot:UN07923